MNPGYELWKPRPKDEITGFKRINYSGRRQQLGYPIFNPSYTPYPTIFKLPSHIQVIVKIASITTTPEKPLYKGGSWHLEGTDSESILATGIYYFDTNLDSQLSFRTLNDPPDYEQNDREGVEEVYGIVDEQVLVTYLGKVECRQGRMVVFKNFCQHRVEAFEGIGTRKILAFFLVNPTKKVLSTKQVPFQNLDLLVEFLRVVMRDRLPIEVLEIIGRYAGAFGIGEARKFRAELMEARSAANQDINDDDELVFSLCEH